MHTAYQDSINQDSINQDSINQNSINQNSSNQDSINQDSINQEAVKSSTVRRPSANLYSTEEGWLLVVALPESKREELELSAEGSNIQLNIPHEVAGVYQRQLHFPKETYWGELGAHWEGDLLHIMLKKSPPERRVIAVS